MSIPPVHFGARIVKFVQKNGVMSRATQPGFEAKQAVRDRMERAGHNLFPHNAPDWLVLSTEETRKFESMDAGKAGAYRAALMAKAEQEDVLQIEFDGQGQLKEASYSRAMGKIEASAQQVDGF